MDHSELMEIIDGAIHNVKRMGQHGRFGLSLRTLTAIKEAITIEVGGSHAMPEPIVCPNCFWMSPQLPKEVETDEQAEEYMRAEWRLNGGSVHGPNVETVTMPEALYFRFRMGFEKPLVGRKQR